MSGFVYLIGSTTFGWYKIGKSITPEVRVQNLGILLPFKVEVLAVWRAENHHALETKLHRRYSEQRINGEWFQFSKKEIGAITDSVSREAELVNSLDKFSNIIEDKLGKHSVVGLKTRKLRGNFTPEERESRRLASIEQQKILKELKRSYREMDRAPHKIGCLYL